MTSQLLSPVTRPETSEVILDPVSVLIAILNGPPSLSFLHFSIAQSHLFVSVCTITSISAAAPPLTGDVSVMVQPEKQNHWGGITRNWLMQLFTPLCCGGWINSSSKAVSLFDAGA